MNYGEVFQTLLQLIHALPNELAEKANPEHPEVALAALREWKERQIKLAGREWHDFIAGLGKPDAAPHEVGVDGSEQSEASGTSERSESKGDLPAMGTEGDSKEGGEA